ncbi:hypothetical protein B1H18_19885 [Streptomyces tsukubensis]|uniref:Uncharacterized protein n=2 Tax=Streptomyces tsukubensis TaxID=83656 RepID=A0A1V4A7A1_9ACTN|nr:hypothetical protein B1H18_19885 [Streptomyces tsukubensis]
MENSASRMPARQAPGQEQQPPQPAQAWDLVTVPSRHGLEAVDILRRSADPAVGPVVHDCGDDTLGFVVPSGTAEAWDMPGSDCKQTSGRGVPLVAGQPVPPVDGGCWLLPPCDSDPVTDPAVLRRALGEAERTLKAADGRQ